MLFFQLNQATHFLDASNLYGSNILRALQLRSLKGGELKTFIDAGREFLPVSKNSIDTCPFDSNATICFLSGKAFTLTYSFQVIFPIIVFIPL